MSLGTRVSGSLTLLLLFAATARPQWEYPNWHQAVLNWSNSPADEAFYQSDNSAQLSWGETYVLQAYYWMFRVDADTLWLHKMWTHAATMMANARDVPLDSTADPVYRDGYRGWGTSRYSDHYEEWLVHDGHLCSELARFVKLVYHDDALYPLFGTRADSLLTFLERNIAAKWHAIWYDPRAELPGDIDMNATYSHWIGAQNLLTFPTNHFAAFGDFALQLLQISRSPHYHTASPDLPPWYQQVVDDVANAFRSVLRVDPVTNAYVWPYAGHTGGNDISHAAIELRFAYDCYRAGVYFDETDMLRFANTLTRLLWANPPDTWNAHLFSHFGGEGDTDYEIYTRNWPLFGFFDPLVYAVEAGVFRPLAEQHLFPSSSTAAAMANLAYVSAVAPPLVKVLDCTLQEERGDGDDLPDPGETLRLRLRVANWGPAVDTLFASLTCADTRVEVTDTSSIYTSVLSCDTTFDHEPPFRFCEKSSVETGGSTRWYITFREGPRARRDSFRVLINPTDVLLVDDDGGASVEKAYQDSVLEYLATYQVWHRDRFGSPGPFLGKYSKLVWLTGQNVNPLPVEDRQALAHYVDTGGKLILFGPRVEDFLLDSASPDTAFFSQILHAKPSDASRQLPFLTLFVKNQTFYPSPYLTVSAGDSAVFRAVEPGPDAQVLVRYSYGPAGIFTNGRHAVAYLTFGLEQVSSHDPVAELRKRRRVLQGLFTLLDQPTGIHTAGPGTKPEIFKLSVYPNPAQSHILMHAIGAKGIRKSILVFDLRGRVVASWVRMQQPVIRWDGTDAAGHPLPSGVYIVRLEAGGQVATRKVVLVR